MKKESPYLLINKKFNRLLIISILPTFRSGEKIIRKAQCLCECGKIVEKRIDGIKSNKIKSCGCLNKELIDQRKFKHGYCQHPLYSVWEGMKERCYKTTAKYYYAYGGRGIKVCDEWYDKPANFIQWGLANGYKKGLQIDRINNDGDYAPDNCRFATPKQNTNNRRNTIRIKYEGEERLLTEWSKIKNIGYYVLLKRIKLKYPIERLFEAAPTRTSPKSHWKRIFIMDINDNKLIIVRGIKIAAKIINCDVSCIHKQLNGKLRQVKGFKFQYE